MTDLSVYRKLILVAFACAVCGVIGDSRAEESPATKPPNSDLVLERVPPKSLEEAMAAFEVADGFRIELVAAEPLVVDPVAMAFDEHGRLFVVEMRDYSEQDKERLGVVRLLSDEDGDGKLDTSQVFADDLSWPTAIACYDGGVFIGNPPEILYCKDTDADGRADERRVVFTGFGRGNVQGLLNSFQWGLDSRIYGSASTAGGKVHVVRGSPDPAPKRKKSPPLDVQGRNFAFDPKTLELEATTGGGQHGLSLNRWGDEFVCHNSDHLQAVVFEERYVARNPYQSVVSARRSIALDGPQAPVYRASPVEGWRIARTKMRLAGLASGPIEGGGRPAGYFTSATGVTVYEGGLWDTGGESWVIIADVGSNLIHRKRLTPDGVTYRGERIDENTEFVRSTDIWFRPVQMAIGPEGALYVADMYREVIEHPTSLPPELKSQLDLTSGRDRGRIYRIVPENYQHAPAPLLATASTEELVNELASNNAWRRSTALRLLYERQPVDAATLLRAQASSAERPETRIATMHALGFLGALSEPDVIAGLNDSHPQVGRHALRLSEPRLNSSEKLLDAVLSLSAGPDLVVQFQLALTLGESADPRATQALADIIARHSTNRDIVDAALTSLADRAGEVLKRLMSNDPWLSSESSQPVLIAIVGQIVRQRHEEDLLALVEALKPSDDGATANKGVAAIVRALSRLPADALAGSDSSHLAELRRLRQSSAAALVRNSQRFLEQGEDAPLEQRIAAIENLALDTFANQRPLLEQLLSPQEPAEIHAAVLATCSEYSEPEVAELVLAEWEQFAPAQRSQASELLLRRQPWAVALLKYLADENISLATLDPAHVARLENYPSPEARQLARSLRGQTISQDRQQVFDDYREAALSGGDPASGKQVFQKNCATCHEVAGEGQPVGPNLASMVNRGAESVLFNVLVPNGEADPRFLEYVVVTSDGQVLTGMIAGETSTAVTLRAPDNKLTTVLRVDIDELQNSGKSLMPEGFEKLIDKRAMADLLTYLQQAAAEDGASQ